MELNKMKCKIFSTMGQPASVFGVALMEIMKQNDIPILESMPELDAIENS